MGNNFEKETHILYITVNKLTKHFYIGVHKTDTPYVFDGYLGCGSWINAPSTYNKGKYALHVAILKYGTSAFVRRTLKVFDNREEALRWEAKIVNKEFVKRPDTYNMIPGGGITPITGKTVYQFDIKGNFIKEWKSETDIKNYYKSKVQLYDIISDKRSFAGSFWNFEKTINIEEYKTECKYGFISQYNEYGMFLQMFNNTTQAAQKLDLDREAITRAVFKKKMYAGFYFLKSDVDVAEAIALNYKPMLGKSAVYRYLSTGEFDKEYTSVLQAEKDLFGASRNAIAKAIINNKLVKGYRWSYIKSDNYFNIENPNYKPEIKIGQYTKEGELIKIWDSPKECKKEFPYALQVCQGKAKSTKGYVFKYLQN